MRSLLCPVFYRRETNTNKIVNINCNYGKSIGTGDRGNPTILRPNSSCSVLYAEETLCEAVSLCVAVPFRVRTARAVRFYFWQEGTDKYFLLLWCKARSESDEVPQINLQSIDKLGL